MTGKQIPTMRSWHRWIGIAIGVVLLVWVVSGIVMMAPHSDALWGTDIVPPALDVSTVTVTPAEAADVASGAGGGAIRAIALRPVLDTAVYMVTPMAGAPVLVNAVTGDLFLISAERAGAIAAGVAPGGTTASIERITVAPPGYNGRLPAFKVSYGDKANTVAIVAEATGEMTRSEGWDRFLRQLGHDLHVFAPLKRLPGGDVARKPALVATGVVALLSIFSGYWLSLPARLRRRKSRPD